MQSTVYHFQATQKAFFAESNLEEQVNFIKSILEKNSNQKNYDENSYQQIKDAINIYGIEAIIFSIFMHPILPGKKIVIKKEDLFTAWKAMNKIFHILSLNTKTTQDNSQYNIYIEQGLQFLEKKKMHLYISSIFHIIKLHKKEGISNNNCMEFISLLKPIFPIISANFSISSN